MPGQDGVGQVVKASAAGLAPVALPVPLGIVTAIPNDQLASAPRTTHAIRPSMLTDQLVTLRIVKQRRQIEQVWRGHETPSGCGSLAIESTKPSGRKGSLLPKMSHTAACPLPDPQHPGIQDEPRFFQTEPLENRPPERNASTFVLEAAYSH